MGKGKKGTYFVTVARWGFYPLHHHCIDTRWASNIEVVVLEGKPREDQDYRSEHISVMVARQDSRENQGDHSWKDATVGRGGMMVEDLKGRQQRESEGDDQLGKETEKWEGGRTDKSWKFCQYISKKLGDLLLTI
jgi:hypothetical protein